ncbi:hypothetical protein X808_10590 [Mannheimia varigena USDA-ARS-USMARC-1296]|uniref:Uncharacterized protein n=1 Tax=Mannheimia varigena USDA-ARS-USMARC-1296 TaxID=1433287 RepID=W0QBB4_9PAST|nr:hypothetical protein X808_10590 [Mannheimia varigena USDA-ARS-USMARC-1296]
MHHSGYDSFLHYSSQNNLFQNYFLLHFSYNQRDLTDKSKNAA